jgi:hypothetical protein
MPGITVFCAWLRRQQAEWHFCGPGLGGNIAYLSSNVYQTQSNKT